MFKLKQHIFEPKIIAQKEITSPTNYSDKDINTLFELGKFTPVLLYRSKAKKLFDLGLSFDESKYLLQTKGLSVDEIVKCVKEFELKADLIKKLNCSKETLLTEIPHIILIVGGIENLRVLIDHQLSIGDIRSLLGQLGLTYYETLSLINYGYKKSEIEAMIGAKFRCEQLVSLAKIITATDVYSLFQEDKQNLYFLLSVRDICNRHITDLTDASECYKILYDNIPDNLCQSLITISRSVPPTDTILNADLTYEDILTHYMDLAGGRIISSAGYADMVTPVLFEVLEKTTRFFRPSEFIDECIPIKPFMLSAIWCALDISLGKQYLENSENINEKVVGRSVLSFLVSSMCGVTGYFHSGGIGLPFPNITSFIRSCFNFQQLIKNRAPKVYNKIPQCLLFETNQAFENLIKEKQISAGQGLSMVYTFRVGNAFLCSLLGAQIISFESAKNIFKSLWPLPQEAESIRMYFIYSGIPIYSKLNLKDVFVSIS